MNLFSIPGEVVFACLGYAAGSLSTGYYLVRLRTGLDIRTIESHATGSTNVGRVLGTPGYIFTLLGDFLKAWLVVWAAYRFRISAPGVAAVLIAVVAGHIWPVQLGFRGGKGLAPGLGALSAVDYRAGLLCGGIAALGPLLGLGTASFLAAAVAAPGILVLFDHGIADIIGVSTMVLLTLFAHRENIRAFIADRRGRKGLQA